MGAIMAVGVAVANAILLVTFAENARQTGMGASEGARTGAEERLRPILMTSCAMVAGMVPMALGLGEGGEQSAPLGRAVIGGLVVATGATLLILPAVFSVVMGGVKGANEWASRLPLRARALVVLLVGESKIGSASLHPDDPESACYAPNAAAGSSHGHGHDEHSHGAAHGDGPSHSSEGGIKPA
jgi:hypothetical protein